jgi:biopolymer transport protein ExbB
LPYYKFNITKIIYLKLLKLKKMANVKKEKVQTGGMISGIIIVACIFVGWLNFIMGNGANFEGGVNTIVTRKYVSNGIQRRSLLYQFY